MPWYVDYIRAAERAGVPPWEMFDCWTPREFWKEALLIVASAESSAHRRRESRQAAMEHADRTQGH